MPFSQRYGYLNPSTTIIRESLKGPILNSTYNFIINLMEDETGIYDADDINFEFRTKVLNLRYDEDGWDFEEIILIDKIPWYTRIDYIEWLLNYIRSDINNTNENEEDYDIESISELNFALDRNIDWLNKEFERHNYAYRIINDIFVETTSSSEIETINEAFEKSDSNVVTHLNECLKLLSPSNPEISIRNAIKEAISAVEVKARQVTNTSTLDRALKKLGDIHPMIKESISKLYYYTNSENTGIRHGWMEQENEPSKDDAIFVLVTSCAFINYLTKIYN